MVHVVKWVKALDVKTSPSYSMGKSIVQLVLETPNEKMDEVLKLLNGKFELVLQKQKKKRTLSANAYMWVLCEKIAQKVNSTKVDIYKQAICRVGVSDGIFTIPSKAVSRQKEAWEMHGIGWVLDVLADDGVTADVVYYYGSSTYTGSEMARLIDWIVDEANELGIDTMTPEQRSLLVDEWDRRKEA